MRYFERSKNKSYNPYIREIHIADIHFGSIDAKTQYQILEEQFLNQIAKTDFDILSIDGDIFDKKFMANSDAVFYAMRFVNVCAELCAQREATMIIIAGTESHDAGQIRLFYEYQDSERYDVRIVESCQFVYAQGLKILCIPEEYDKGEEYYRQYLDDIYDTAFIHGTVVGAVYGAVREDLDSKKYPIFSIDSFAGCRGPIICGHVHKAMCLNGYIYYCSNPIRYRFGEEEEKGFNIVHHNLMDHSHLLTFIPIQSFRYDTIDAVSLPYTEPKAMIEYLDNLLANDIDYIRLDFSRLNDPTTQKIMEQYYSTNPKLTIKRYTERGPEYEEVDPKSVMEEKYKGLEFLIKPDMSEMEKFVAYINFNEGRNFITIDKLKSILAGADI